MGSISNPVAEHRATLRRLSVGQLMAVMAALDAYGLRAAVAMLERL